MRKAFLSIENEDVYYLLRGTVDKWNERYKVDEHTRMALPVELITKLEDSWAAKIPGQIKKEPLYFMGIKVYYGYESAVVIYDYFDARKEVIRVPIT